MTAGRARFGSARIAWVDSASSAAPPLRVLERLGTSQIIRHASMRAEEARRFLAGRALLVSLVDELTDIADLGFSTACERCGGDHGGPRLERAPVAVSVSYAGSVVAVAAAVQTEAVSVGVDIERLPADGAARPLRELDRLFSPRPAPDIQGWTLIEAALKADGRGLAVDLADLEVGEEGTGVTSGSRAVRIPGRLDPVDAAVIPGPSGFVLSAAMVPVVGERHPA
jgi:4'-phosphopantetheinyl transferase